MKEIILGKSKPVHIAYILFMFMIGCTTTVVRYNLSLTDVERPADTARRYGETIIDQVLENDTTKYKFTDSLIEILFLTNYKQFEFILTNKTSHSIKIIWDEAAFIDGDGISKRVIHSGIKYNERSAPQPVSVVAKGSSISDLLCPADNVYLDSYFGWMANPIITEADIGKTVQLLLPFEIEGVVNEYLFRFKINNVTVEQINTY